MMLHLIYPVQLRILAVLAFICCATHALYAQIHFVNTSKYYEKPYKRDSATVSCFSELSEPLPGKRVTINGKAYYEFPVLICQRNIKQLGLDAEGRVMYNFKAYTNSKGKETRDSLGYKFIDPKEALKDSIRLSADTKHYPATLYHLRGDATEYPGTKWVKKRGDASCLSSNPEDCMVYCLVEALIKVPGASILIVNDTTATKTWYRAYFDVKDGPQQIVRHTIICPEKIPLLIDQLHERLTALGYLEPTDKRKHKYDETLRDALSNFQEDNDLPTGFLNAETLQKLGL